MDKLIAGLQILANYIPKDSKYWGNPICSDGDVLYINVAPKMVSNEDKQKLEVLGFEPVKMIVLCA